MRRTALWSFSPSSRPYDVIARAQAQDLDELGKLVASRVQVLDGVTPTMSCPVIHL
jgi:hypothetical protein